MARIIFYQENGAKELEKWISLYLKEDDIVFERDRHFYPSTRGGAVSRKTYEDYLTEEDSYGIDRLALRVSENWYKRDDGEGVSLYEGVSLGKMVEYKLMKYLVALFKDIALLTEIKEKEKPISFIFVDNRSAFSELLKGFSKRYEIEIEAIPSSLQGDSSPLIARKESRMLRNKNIKSLIWHIMVFFMRFYRKKAAFKKTILIEGYGKFIPLVKRLAGEGNKVIVIGRLGFERGLFKPNIFYYTWSRFKWTSHLTRSLRGAIAMKQSQGLFVQHQSIGVCAIRNELKTDFDASQFIIEKIEEVIQQDLPDIMASIIKIKRFLKSQHVDTIITLQDRDGINRTLAASGNSLGIKTIEIQHGSLANLPYLVPPVSQKICVWGRASREFYIKREIDEKRVYIVGEPNLEGLKKIDSKRIANLKKDLTLSPDRRTVLFTSQPFIEISSLDSPLNTLDLFRVVCEAASELSGIDFLIKFHPGEDSYLKKEILKEYYYGNLFLARRGVTSELLSLSHALITFCSSTVLEASLLGVPIIVVNLTGKRDLLPIVEMGGALGVYKKQDLVPSIRAALYDEKVKERLLDGQKRFVAFRIDLKEPSLNRMMELI